MTQENKELLLQDLCSRLPYGVKVSKVVEGWTSDPHPIRSISLNNIIVEDGEFEDGTPDIDVWDYEDIKPYLFPLSSMTEEQKEEWRCIRWSKPPWEELDWLNKGKWDYRHLIEKSLALDATGLNIY